MNDNIAAISTALGVGAISIIRISGEDSINIVNRIFSKDLSNVKSHTIHYGFIKDSEKIIDEVLISVMRSPKTFTTENIVEINCHGGIATTNKIFELVLLQGARIAEPGEFVKRAFLNGRIDLVEAEGIMDLINAKTEEARGVAINQVDGKVSELIKNLRQNIIEVLANIEVNIDYPEYEDIEEVTNEKLVPKIKEVKNKINEILISSENGKVLKDGIKTAIIGRPNVGKSSILNSLLGEEKAIVTDIEGTTRDTVEGTINVNGLLLNMIDTAGIRDTDDVVEKIGVSKSLELIDKADLVLMVINNNEKISDYDLKLLERLKEKNYIVIINKVDLNKNIDESLIDAEHKIYMSALNKQGITDLTNKVKEIFNLEKIKTKDLTFLTNARSIAKLKEALNLIIQIENGFINEVPVDLLEIDIKRVWTLLGEIIGVTYEDELVDQLFSQFCLGK